MRAESVISLDEVSEDAWAELAGSSIPHLSHPFLLALETSGSVGPGTGWQPRHLLLEEGGRLLAAMPLWHKTHSWGEYVFDQEWARAYARHGLAYYPKLVGAVPFTPAGGPRLLVHPDIDPRDLLDPLRDALHRQLAADRASGWHILFPDSGELPLWQALGADLRLGCQFHWFNRDYRHFDDFLAALNAKRRKEIRRERRRVAEQGVTLLRLTGDALRPEHWITFYDFYRDTYRRRSGHDGYLTESFFHTLHRVMPERLLLVLAERDGEPVGGAFCLIGDDTLYGRYWGAREDIECLHFEACLYQGIEFCIERGLTRFDPGAQGEHKIPRGFEPVLTHSAHWLAHPGFREAVKEFLREEGEAVMRYRDEARGWLPFRGD